MKRLLQFAVIAAIFLCSCNDSPEPPPGSEKASTEELKQSDMAANEHLR